MRTGDPVHPVETMALAVATPRWRATFSSLGTRNYRLYMYGQVISMAGTFMQAVAQAWLIVKITGSGAALGLAITLQYLPVLVFVALAGVIIDRADRRRLYMCTQSLAGAEAIVLGALVATGTVRLWMVYVCAAVLGLVNSIDQPLRQTLTYDLVGPRQVSNAVALTMAVNNTSKVVGPAIAGVLIGTLGIAPCFFLNAVSFLGVIIAMLVIRPAEMTPAPAQPRSKGQFRRGLAYVRTTPDLLGTLVILAVVFGLGWQFEVLLPLLAKFSFHGGASSFGLMSASLGVGSLVGGLLMAGRPRMDDRAMLTAMLGLAVAVGVAGVVPWYPLELVALAGAGAGGITVAAVCSPRLQLRSTPEMRGRVMSLYVIAVQGTRPVGGPVVGVLAEHVGPRWCLLACAASVVAVGVPVWAVLVKRPSAAALAAPVLVAVE